MRVYRYGLIAEFLSIVHKTSLMLMKQLGIHQCIFYLRTNIEGVRLIGAQFQCIFCIVISSMMGIEVTVCCNMSVAHYIW